MTDNRRLHYLDIAKGIGIILVVLGHCAPYSGWVYGFHMPLFFFISGYLYNEKYSFKDYTLNKVKRLYIPFVFWNLLCFLIKYLFLDILPTKYIIFTFVGIYNDGLFLGAVWFIGNLFVVSVGFKLLDIICRGNKLLVTAICLVLGFIGYYYRFSGVLYACAVGRLFYMGVFFAFGCLAKKYGHKIKLNLIISVLCLCIYFVSYYLRINSLIPNYLEYIVYSLGALVMMYSTFYISNKIDILIPKVGSVISLIGKRSMDNVTWHFIAFRIVTAIQLLIYHLPLNTVLDYYPYFKNENGWWVAYAVVGIVVPILWGYFLQAGEHGKILRRFYII